VHQAVAFNTETDVPNWVYQRREHHRQTARHSMPTISLPALARTKDGRWLLPYRTYLPPSFGDPFDGTVRLLQRHGMAMDLNGERYRDPAYRNSDAVSLHIGGVTDAFVGRTLYARDLWREAQEEGLPWAPCRRPEENLVDEHWRAREAFFTTEHPELGQAFDYVGGKWLCQEVPWARGPRAPLLGEHTAEVLGESARRPLQPIAGGAARTTRSSPLGAPFALAGVRVVEMSWLLASAGAGRFLASMGAEVIKVEHDSRIDAMRFGVAFAPAGGRAQRNAATEPIDTPQTDGLNRSGAFMEINAGKLALSLNLKKDRARDLLTGLIADADMIVEGFSPGTMDRMGFGYEHLKEINPRIIYVQQSGMGQTGTYGRMRSYGPTAAAFAGLTEMSGLPDPFAPAGIGYSYLDWFGAYNMSLAMLAALYRQRTTGKGCWIDASQAEAGLYLAGTSILDASVNQRAWQRYGNRSPYKLAAPHGIYPAAGEDRWIAIACFDDAHWRGLLTVLHDRQIEEDRRFETLAQRLHHEDALDDAVGRLTSSWEAFTLMAALQAAGVPAGVCQTAEDRCDSDPQLAHLGWTVELEQQEIGIWPVKETPITLSRTPTYIGGPLDRHGPSYAQDTDDLLKRLLGLDDDEIAQLHADGVV
jgi:crotonobetainyl-CoA:carnitine CoA-transferase CaiB-like acyl-CoA transferase